MDIIKQNISWVIAVFVALGIGIVVSFTSVFFFISFLFIAGSMTLLGLVAIIIRIRSSLRSHYAYHVVISTVLSVVFAISFFYLQHFIKEKEANKIIENLSTYKNQQGNYPESLQDLSYNPKLVNLDYEVDSTKLNYEIRYSYDGWSWKSYNSKTGEWEITD